jgi:hypothetical protein
MVTDKSFFFFPSGVANLLAQVYGQQQKQRGSLQHLYVGTSQTGVYQRSDLCTPVRPVKVTGQTFAGVNRWKTSKRHPGKIPSGRRT